MLKYFVLWEKFYNKRTTLNMRKAGLLNKSSFMFECVSFEGIYKRWVNIEPTVIYIDELAKLWTCKEINQKHYNTISTYEFFLRSDFARTWLFLHVKAFRHNPCDIETLEWLASYYLETQYPDKAVEFCAQAALVKYIEEFQWLCLMKNKFILGPEKSNGI